MGVVRSHRPAISRRAEALASGLEEGLEPYELLSPCVSGARVPFEKIRLMAPPLARR